MLLIPAFGDRLGHWLEFMPLVVVTVLIGFRILQRWPADNVLQALLVGVMGVLVLLILESIFALIILGMSVPDYLASFNIFNGELFPLGLLFMAVVPAVFMRQKNRKKFFL